MKKLILSSLTVISVLNIHGQNTFTSPGSQSICGTTSPSLAAVTSVDEITLISTLRLSMPCLDTDLALFSFNSPAVLRKPTFCYNNGYFPDSYGFPIAISRNSTANSGGCQGAESIISMDFSTGTFRPNGLQFYVCDIDNPYDTFKLEVFSGGTLVNYSFEFMEPDTDSSYIYTTHSGNSGNSVHFNGGANGVWGESSKTSFWERGAVKINVDTSIFVDSIILTHYIRNNRNDINAGISVGMFTWADVNPMSINVTDFSVKKLDNIAEIKWTSSNSAKETSTFRVQRSADAQQWSTIHTVVADGMQDVATYTFIDEQPLVGKNFYRLEIIEAQSATYTTTKMLQFGNSNAEIHLYPNPTTGLLYIKTDDFLGQINILNAMGQLMYQSYENSNATQIDLSTFTPGLYQVQIIQASHSSLHKIILK